MWPRARIGLLGSPQPHPRAEGDQLSLHHAHTMIEPNSDLHENNDKTESKNHRLFCVQRIRDASRINVNPSIPLDIRGLIHGCGYVKQHLYYVALCLLLVMLNGGEAASIRYQFPDVKQGNFAQDLTDFHISTPSRVDHTGRHLTFDLRAKPTFPGRSKRHTGSENVSPPPGDAHDEKLHYQIALHPQGRVTVELTPNKILLAPSAIVERKVSDFKNASDSRISSLEPHRGCHYFGHVTGDDNSRVALSVCNGLRGLVRYGGEDYLIEPVKGHNPADQQGQPHLVYKRSARPERSDSSSKAAHHESTCGVEDRYTRHTKAREMWEKHRHNHGTRAGNSGDHSAPGAENSHSRRKRSISTNKYVETLVVVDTEMVQHFDGIDEDIETYVLAVMNVVANLFHQASIGNAINIVVVKIIQLTRPEESLQITHHADKTLKSFCKFQKEENNNTDDDHPLHHDVAVLLTKKDICSRMNEPCNTLGLAQVNGLCQPYRSCSIVQDNGVHVPWTIAHELGHNFGMKHDNLQEGCETDEMTEYIMSSQFTGGPKNLKWSTCSKDAITKFLDRDWGYCLDDPPGPQVPAYPDRPIGIIYDADTQCRLLYGYGATRCNETEALENICTTLWCRIHNKCATNLHPAADGTICGKDKWCVSGQCVELADRPAIDGQWGEWAEWTSCTRTCGAGISFSERHCDHPPPEHGGKYCTGERKRYRICNSESCQNETMTFRAEQCAHYNSQLYKGSLYEWEPTPNPGNPCQLICKPKEEHFSVLLNDIVKDGTPCITGTRSMCISGRCRHVGCDWIIDSNAVEDKCGVCFGDGSTCTTIKQQFNETKKLGYVEATVIPAGARNIRVEEVAEANNFLALKNDAGKYYLNGYWFIQWSGDYEVAGTIIHYKRVGNKEVFLAPGPLKEPLHIMLLMQSHNPGVEFEYTVPKENATDTRKPEYNWDYTAWSHCTLSCGGGTQRSSVVCKELENVIVDDMNCDQNSKPDDKLRVCNVHLCPARWWTGAWQRCSVTCGDTGTHRRTVICVRSLGSSEQIALEDKDCESLDRPEEVEPCHHKDPCPGVGVWQAEEWSECSRLCNGGVQFRRVTCVGGVICDDQKPEVNRSCNEKPCLDENLNILEGGADTDDLNPKFPVPSGMLSQNEQSFDNNKNVIIAKSHSEIGGMKKNEDVPTHHKHRLHHSHLHKKKSDSPDMSTNIAEDASIKSRSATAENSNSPRQLEHKGFNFAWQISAWSECSATCGHANRSRKVECPTPGQCDLSRRPETTQPCENLPACLAWINGSWSQCSKTCGGAQQERSVECVNLSSQQLAKDCDGATKPVATQNCNMHDCPPEDNAALTVSCVFKEKNSHLCQVVKKIGLCNKQHMKAKCCLTCQDHNETKDIKQVP
ncbi:A disintegrin and metalloproteinase with thrombospondin motifs 7-like [Physella acuta]|uniref:A disintegrin and metalloproteinase with thrombospondin motifs 7-like n=1 Tax=Physella acuta TaxID=109671 RepID=UPI0027DB9A6F|nr:A disintegrin and metalloproteinase with thrombospondin motifs 7-like [Physella acuta]